MAETIVLDASEVASSGRSELDLTPFIASAGVDWGDAAFQGYMGELAVGSSVVDYRLPNRNITIPLVIKTVGGTTFAAARSAIQLKVGQWQNSGGWIKRITSSGGTVFCDVVSAQLHLGGDWVQAHRDADINAAITLEALPDFYGAEETLSDHTETTNPELIFTEATSPGDFPLGDRVRIVVDDDSANNQRGLIWGFRCANYSSATTASLAYEAEALQALDTATAVAKVGASGGTVVTHGTLSTNWTPVLGTNMGGTTFLTHVGSYRAWARVFTTSGTAVQARFVYDVGDLVYPTENNAVRCYDGGTFHVLDLGEVRLDQPPNTTGYRWQGQIQAKGDVGTENFSVDRVCLQPVDETAGVLRAPIGTAQDGFTAFAGRSEFNTESGAVTGDSAAVGGAWAALTGSDTSDFDVSGGLMTRTAVSDSGAIGGGVTALLGRAVGLDLNLGNTVATLRFKRSLDSTTIMQGLMVRVVDGSNFVAATVTNGVVAIYVDVGGTPSAATSTVIPTLTLNAWHTLKVVAIGSSVFAFLDDALVSSVTDSRIGSTLATGDVYVYDHQTDSTAATRTYDDFAVRPAVLDAVTFASQSVELNTLGITREDTGGTAYGPVSVVNGDLPRMPNRASGGTAEVFVRASRGDLDTINDPAIDDISAKAYRRASYLLVP